MSFIEFCQALAAGGSAPSGLTAPLLALWRDSRGQWNDAHAAVQSDSSRDAAWVHAYLHRKEGDLANAAYWYRRADRPVVPPTVTLEAEWTEIARALLGGTTEPVIS